MEFIEQLEGHSTDLGVGVALAHRQPVRSPFLFHGPSGSECRRYSRGYDDSSQGRGEQRAVATAAKRFARFVGPGQVLDLDMAD